MSNRPYRLLDREDVKSKIEDSLERSKTTKKEHGFEFYLSGEKIVTTEIAEGGKESIDTKGKHPKGATLVGAFHVHSRLSGNDVSPSPTDIKKGITEDINFFCVGASIDNRKVVRCFTKGDLESEMRHIFKELGLKKSKVSVDRSSRLIAGRMISDKDYLEKHSHKKIYKK